MKQPSEIEEVNDFGAIAHVYDQLVAWAPYEKWVDDLLSRLRKHGLRDGATILDIGCGTGLSSFPLCRRGFDVTGIDCSEAMLKRAERKAQQEELDFECLGKDLLDMHLGRRFDAVICMHSGLDYIIDLERLQRAFHVVREHVKRGGLFAFDKCLDEPEFYQKAVSNSRELEDGTAMFKYQWDRETRMFRQTCVIWQKDEEGEPKRTKVVHDMRAVSLKRLMSMVEKAGFEVLEPTYQFSISDPGMGIFRAV